MGRPRLTRQAVVFEPEKERVYLAGVEPEINAHSCSRITVNIEDLLTQ